MTSALPSTHAAAAALRPVDLPSYLRLRDDDVPFALPPLRGAHDLLGTALVRCLVQATLAHDDQAARDIGLCVLSDLYLDAVRIGRVLFDLAAAREDDVRLLYDHDASPLTAWLDAGQAVGEPPLPPDLATPRPGRGNPFARPRAFAAAGRRDLALLLPARGPQLHLHTRCDLLAAWLGDRSERVTNLQWQSLPWPERDDVPVPAAALADALTAAAAELLDDLEMPRVSRDAFVRYVRACARGRLARAWHDLEFLRRESLIRRPAAALVSGTPKTAGRLLGLHYRENGRQVLRFAHGGDRVFFEDAAWAIAEFPYADFYHVHSGREAANVRRRLDDGRLVAGFDTPEIVALGSPRHRAIFAASGGPRQVNRRRLRVMYASGAFLGEALVNSPQFKAPDVIAADLELAVLTTLRTSGAHVVLKPHPKGLFRDRETMRGLADTVDQRLFDPRQHDVDCYVFDFAGTAFFDALASDKGVVLIDTGIRPLDPASRSDLERRCVVMPIVCDERNRPSVEAPALVAALERACSISCTAAFAERYFGK